jgi:hypothetical protein
LHDRQFWCLDTAHRSGSFLNSSQYSGVLLKRPLAESWCQPFA